MSQNTQTMDYLAPSASELAQRTKAVGDPSTDFKGTKSEMARALARRLLPACVVTPALLWWLLIAGKHVGLYSLETCCILFVFSITAVFGLIICMNLKRLARMDAERAQAEAQLKRTKDAAEAANRFKSVFFANISHEIRTPLTAINGFAELLLNSNRTDDERMADARVIRRNGEHLLALINDILDLSKIEAGKMSVDRVLCNPAAVVGEVASMLSHRAEEKGLSLEVKFDGPIPKNIQTDPTRLRQVLINLVANAVKFTKQGGVTLNVSITPSLRDEKPLLQVKITDTGIGITPEQQASLFKPFVQGDPSITRQFGGSGLGLAISQHFARALGGQIAIASEPSRGSTFTVTVETGNLANVPIQEHPEHALDAQDSFKVPRVRINGSILVAEDGIDNQALIAARLRETGLKLEIAPNGKIACEKALAAMAAGKPFDLILMDVQMPVMDGFAATLHLRGKGYRAPIIALTANAMERDRNKCLTAGCNDFVTKPIRMEKLIKAMGRYMKVTDISKENKEDAATLAARAALAQKFYQELPTQLAQIDQAIEKQDRVRLQEAAQLVLGKAATAGLKDIAPQAARLLHSAQNEQSWTALRQAASDFAKDCKPPTPKAASQAA
jgi:signal transduction histidine kinase/DNA-binding NarL/FixJ family response regulator